LLVGWKIVDGRSVPIWLFFGRENCASLPMCSSFSVVLICCSY
jgi:hypothetical protein